MKPVDIQVLRQSKELLHTVYNLVHLILPFATLIPSYRTLY